MVIGLWQMGHKLKFSSWLLTVLPSHYSFYHSRQPLSIDFCAKSKNPPEGGSIIIKRLAPWAN
jgi:hypothetical protein